MTRLALAVATCLLLGCPGGAADLCAGVTCSPGRTCVLGVCQSGGGDSGGSYRLDGGTSAPDSGLGADTLSADTLGLDALGPDTMAPDSATPDTAPPPDLDLGRWYQVDRATCPTYCAGKGMSNTPSPDGCRCMSGEARPQSGIAQGIVFTYGTTGTGLAQAGITTSSYGKYCYRPGQKQDDDKTDYTVGCFCR